MATVAIVGATGGIGQHVLLHAVAYGHTVRVLARDASQVELPDRVTIIEGDVRDADALERLLDGVQVVVSCLGTRRREAPVVAEGTAALLDAMDALQIPRLIWISAIGVGNSRPQLVRMSKVFAWIIQPLLLRAAYADLEEAERIVRKRRSRTAVTVRPAGLSNKPGARNWRQGDHTVRVGATIARADVAAFMVKAIDDTQWDGQAVSLGGA